MFAFISQHDPQTELLNRITTLERYDLSNDAFLLNDVDFDLYFDLESRLSNLGYTRSRLTGKNNFEMF